jgi:hypothetical protein
MCRGCLMLKQLGPGLNQVPALRVLDVGCVNGNQEDDGERERAERCMARISQGGLLLIAVGTLVRPSMQPSQWIEERW